MVREVTGEVTARRDAADAARPLAKGAELYADDTITTAEAASVMVEIHHNGVVLDIAGGKSVRLCDSVAWKAPRGTDPGLLDNPVSDRTTVAGRPAEREAADTTATARLTADRHDTGKGDSDNATKKGGGDKTAFDYEDQSEDVAAGESGGPAITRFEVTPPDVSLAEEVEPMVRAALAEKLPGCYQAVLGAVPGAEGQLTLTLEVDAAGKLRVVARSFSPILDDCARAAVAKLPVGAGKDDAGKPAAATLVIEITFTP